MQDAPAAVLPTAVVWADRGEAEPRELVSVLASGGFQVVLVGDPYMAAAEVCRLHRAQRGRGGAEATLRLVIVGPADARRAAAVCEALWRYAPAAPCWVYGPGGAPRLRPVTEADLGQWAPPSEPARGVDVGAGGGAKGTSHGPQLIDRKRFTHPAAPQLRLAGTGELPPKPADANADGDGDGAEGAGEDSRPLLTPEELEMLLGDADGAGR